MDFVIRFLSLISMILSHKFFEQLNQQRYSGSLSPFLPTQHCLMSATTKLEMLKIVMKIGYSIQNLIISSLLDIEI